MFYRFVRWIPVFLLITFVIAGTGCGVDSVEEYSYSLTTLESVFLNLCQNNNNSGNLNKDDKTYIKVRL